MVRKEMSKTSSIPAEKKLAASKTRLKIIMLQGLNRMCEESEKAVVIKGQLSLVEKLFQETDALQSAYEEEALEAEEQQASMIDHYLNLCSQPVFIIMRVNLCALVDQRIDRMSRQFCERMVRLVKVALKNTVERSAGPSVRSSCSSQQRDGDGHCPSGGSLLEILFVAHGLLRISTCVHRYGSGLRSRECSSLVLLAPLLVVESSIKSPGTTLFSCHVRKRMGLISGWTIK
ncbi:hypothetical protein T11_12703 [Trichinella zimbabwensis]|uniref:Uncharacterized protein n=1 Tax=Trichinella zimbabwensis TaxID=268475 RepID=A0A0V1HPY3_9BILA|nr:hypothetical protein T11_12703 [Trichinella zimbabwensis]